jgi:hypothetical protein
VKHNKDMDNSSVGRRLRGAGQSRRLSQLLLPFVLVAVAWVGISKPAFVGAAGVAMMIGDESTSSSSMLLRRTTTASSSRHRHEENVVKMVTTTDLALHETNTDSSPSPETTVTHTPTVASSKSPTSSSNEEPTTVSPSTQPTTTTLLSPKTTTTSPAPTIPEYQYYPMQYADFRVCIAAKPYPTNVALYADDCSCCKEHGCDSDMSHCGEKMISNPGFTPTPPGAEIRTPSPSSVPTTAITEAATAPEYLFYPMQYADFRVCIAAKPYPANITLYADDCSCCKEHGCDSDMSHCGEKMISNPGFTPTPPGAEISTPSPTSVPTTAITEAAIVPEYIFYPMQYADFRVCIAAKPYPANITLYADDCECCKEHGCDSDMTHCGEKMTSSTTPTVATPTPKPTAATPEYLFYPMQYGDFRVCVAAKPYPANYPLRR